MNPSFEAAEDNLALYQEEIALLHQQVLKLKEMIKNLQEEDTLSKQLMAESQEQNLRQKQRADKLAALVMERERKISELQQYEYGFRRMHEQKQEFEALLNRQNVLIDSLKNEKEQVSKEVEEAKQHSAQLERVILFLRERQEDARLEKNQFQEEHQRLQQAFAEANERADVLQKNNGQLEKFLLQERKAKEEAAEEIIALQRQFEALKQTIIQQKQQLEVKNSSTSEMEAKCQLLKEQLEEAQQKMGQLQQELETQKGDMQSINCRMESADSTREEAESRLKIAQQHLAKKLKENSDLAEKIEHKDALIQEFQENNNQLKISHAEIQNALEIQLLQEKRLREQLQEAVRNNEALTAKWEEKYFKLSEKWQESEGKIRELTKLEERYHQMQKLLTGLGSVLGSPFGYLQVSPEKTMLQPPNEAKIQKLVENEAPPPSEIVKNYQNLFDLPKISQRQKTSLFE